MADQKSLDERGVKALESIADSFQTKVIGSETTRPERKVTVKK